jgi:hypothetical protein
MGSAGEESEVYKVAARLAQAADDRDAAAYRACLADRIWTDSSRQSPPIAAEQYVRDSMSRLSRAAWTHHRLMNAVIDIDGEGRRATARIDVVVETCRIDERGEHLRSTIGGRYHLELVRSDRSWLIDVRLLSRRYAYGAPLPPVVP